MRLGNGAISGFGSGRPIGPATPWQKKAEDWRAIANLATPPPLFRWAIPTSYPQRFEGNLNDDTWGNTRGRRCGPEPHGIRRPSHAEPNGTNSAVEDNVQTIEQFRAKWNKLLDQAAKARNVQHYCADGLCDWEWELRPRVQAKMVESNNGTHQAFYCFLAEPATTWDCYGNTLQKWVWDAAARRRHNRRARRRHSHCARRRHSSLHANASG